MDPYGILAMPGQPMAPGVLAPPQGPPLGILSDSFTPNYQQGLPNIRRTLPDPSLSQPYGPLGQSAGFMGVRAGFQPPVADMQFTMTPQNFDPNAARNQAALADRTFNNDQPLNRPAPNFGEPSVDPFGSMDAERAIQSFAPQQQPSLQQIMQMLAAGAGQEA